MVEGHNQNISSNDSITTPDSKSGELITWVRALQQALTVEVDHGFTNIQGRTNIKYYQNVLLGMIKQQRYWQGRSIAEEVNKEWWKDTTKI